MEAAVRWYKSGQAGLQFATDMAAAGKKETPLRDERTALVAEARLRRAGRRQYVAHVSDLTPRGCRIEFIERPKQGETLWLKFGGLDSIEAAVRWVDGFHGGLEFLRPIHAAVFELLL